MKPTIEIMEDGAIRLIMDNKIVPEGEVREKLVDIAHKYNIDISTPNHRKYRFNTREVGKIVKSALG